MDFDLILKYLGGAVTIVTGIGTIYVKWVKPHFKRLKEAKEKQRQEAIQQMSGIKEQLSGLIHLVDDIKHQVFPNGGGSLIDSQKRVEDGLIALNFKMDDIEENNRVFYQMQGISFWVSNAQGETVYVSPNLCKLVERSESELLGNQWISCLTKADEQRISEEWRRSVIERRPFDEFYEFKTASGVVKVHGLAFHKKSKSGLYTGSMGHMTESII